LRADANFFDASVLLEGGSDGDVLFLANGLGTESTVLNGGDGADMLTVQNLTAGRLQINAGSDADRVEVRSSAFDRFFAQLGDGNDQMTVRGNRSRFETILDGGLGVSDLLIDLGNSFFSIQRRQGFESFR
jgi:hypothetical protein